MKNVKKLIRLNICLILLLLANCKTYCQTTNKLPSTGEQLKTASVSLKDIRLIDSLLIEYKYLKKEVVFKDSIIFEYDKLADSLIVDNKKLYVSTKQKDKTIKKLTIASIGTSIIAILALIFK